MTVRRGQGTVMPGIDEGFWDQLDARIAATIVRAPRRLRPPQASSNPARVSRPASMIEVQAERHHVSDWTGLVETISAAGAAAQVQDERLRERNAAYEVLAGDLRRALDDVERYKGLVAQAQAQAEAKAREIQALAEARIDAIQARADARVQRAEERAHAADQRVIVVEDWLTTFEEASRSLLPALRAPIAKAS